MSQSKDKERDRSKARDERDKEALEREKNRITRERSELRESIEREKRYSLY